jgi:NtrC-family two-component system sensor histidine kinase KinB
MKIKLKLMLGIGILFAMILLLTILSILFVNNLSGDTKNILVANYNTLDYGRKMEMALNSNFNAPENQKLFADNLKLQQQNLSEEGEQELTDSLSIHYSSLQKRTTDSALKQQVRKDISNIMLLNMQAIQRKSKIAEETSDESKFWITLLGTICFIVALTLLLVLPGSIADPIKELSASIRQIAEKNYSQRVHFQKQNEFGELAESFNSMAEKLEEYQASSLQKLMIEKKRIETLINNMNDPVIGLDENRKIIFMNNIALKITGLKPDNVLGKPVQDIAVQNDLIRSLVQDLFKPAEEVTAKKTLVKIYADEKESYFEKEIIPINIIPTGEKEEKRMGNVILLQNITPYKELDFAKTNFISIVSHELKTPISSIKMSLQLLENDQIGDLNDEQKSLVHSIKDDASRLLKITGELLNMTQVETGSIQMSVLPSSAHEIVEYAINANHSTAENKQIQVQINIPENIPQVLADKDKSAWVLTNLISNAIRYSYDNSTVYVNVTDQPNDLLFSVKDTGQGIASEYIDKVFDRYFRIPGTKKEGTGLGLSISKEFIEAQNGVLSVKSELGSGSTFSFTLPKA